MKGRTVTTKTNLLFIAWKYFAAFPYVSFSRLSVTWDEASWRCLHVFPVLVHGKKWTVGQEYQTAYVKLCSWHKCKVWCQKTWPFVEVYLRSKKQITGSWWLNTSSPGWDSCIHFSNTGCRHFWERAAAVLINMFLCRTWSNFKGFQCYCLTFRLFPTRDM